MKVSRRDHQLDLPLPTPNMIEVDGMPCIRRAGRIWMFDKHAAAYVGKTESSYRSWVCLHRLTRIRHGKFALSPKEEIDRLTGSLDRHGE